MACPASGLVVDPPAVSDTAQDGAGRWTRGRLWTWGLLALVLLFAAGVRWRLLSVPLERDEGEYAYAGQLILQGVPPYSLAYNMKLPGTYAAYALIMALFGQTIRGIHLGLLLLNTATILVEFLLARRLFGEYAGVAAAACYALLSLGQPVLGVFAHATHFVVLPALAGLLLLLQALESGRLRTLFLSGLLLGLGFVMKQHGLFFVLFGLFYLAWERLRAGAPAWRRLVREAAVFSIAAALPFALTCAALALAGVFGDFWFWTFEYAWAYATEQPLAAGMRALSDAIEVVIGPSALVWGIAGIGLIALVLRDETRGRRVFTVGFLLASVASICPGLYFREHYFVLLLPAAALLVGLAVDSLRRALLQTPPAGSAPAVAASLFLAVMMVTVYSQAPFLFGLTPGQASRHAYGLSPFPEAIEIARYLEAHTPESERIAVLGSEPEIFFYAGRRSATGYIYMYGLMEDQPYALKMQQQMIREIEASAPRYLVLVNVPSSWTARPDSVRLVFEWYQAYTRDAFEKVGLVDLVSTDETDYFWDREAAARSPRSPYYVEILRRKADS